MLKRFKNSCKPAKICLQEHKNSQILRERSDNLIEFTTCDNHEINTQRRTENLRKYETPRNKIEKRNKRPRKKNWHKRSSLRHPPPSLYNNPKSFTNLLCKQFLRGKKEKRHISLLKSFHFEFSPSNKRQTNTLDDGGGGGGGVTASAAA